MSLLNAAHIENQTKIFRKLVERGTGANKASTSIGFKKKDYPLTFGRFSNQIDDKHIFLITIDLNMPTFAERPWKEIFAHTVAVIINGVSTDSRQLTLTLKHFGNSSFSYTKNDTVFFTHVPTTLSMTYDFKDKIFVDEVIQENLIGNAKEDIRYLGVSPFATWAIEVDTKGSINKGFNMQNITEIIFKFDFNYRIT